MKKEIHGILEVDFPGITDEQIRGIELGTLKTLPGGKKVAKYQAEVEELKQSRLKAEAEKRDEDLRTLASNQPKKEEKEQDAADTVTDEDVSFDAEVVEEPAAVEDEGPFD